LTLSRIHRLLLWCAATDRTYVRTQVDGKAALVGKCIHCGRKLAIDLAGRPLSDASLEHILPRHHGGDDALNNLAIACTRCNAQKGYRHDCQRRDDPKLQSVLQTLRARRSSRLRPALRGLVLPPLPGDDET
jgi:5-methylcytosine-specific restriction endonuclease McrA